MIITLGYKNTYLSLFLERPKASVGVGEMNTDGGTKRRTAILVFS